MENSKNEEIIALIQFNQQTKKVILTPTFEEYKKKICKILQLDESLFNSLKTNYNDEDNDVILVGSDEDYNILIDQIKNNEVNVLNIEIDKNSNIDLNACTENFLNFQENLEKKENNEENKDKKDLNIILNQRDEINGEEEIYNKQKNFIRNNKNIINEINNNNMNNINNINNINIINNINNINDINSNNNNTISNRTCMVFPFNCNLCNQYPIVKVLYYCPVCALPFCEKCEEKLGINHRHSILKVQTNEQYDDLNLKINASLNQGNNQSDNNDNVNQSKIQQFANNIKNSFFGGIFGGNDKKNDINNIDNGNQRFVPQQMSLIQLARTQYDLNGISDNQLQDAINKTNGDVDKAIVLLMS
jgi:hypothetical protein